MRITIIILLTLIIHTCGFSQIQFSKDDWTEIKKRSKLENKAIFVDVYTQWCGPCKKLDRTTFQNAELGAYMNKHFINVKWDAESEAYQAISRAHGVSSFPTLMFMDHNEVEYKRIIGFQDEDRMLKQSQDMVKFLTTDFEALSDALLIKKDKKEIEHFLLDNKGLNFESKGNVFDLYFELIESKDKLTSDEIEILIDNLSTIAHVEKAVLHLPTGKPTSAEDMRKKIRYQSIIKAVISNGIKQTTKYKKIESFEMYLDLNYEFAKKINALSKGEFAINENIDHRLHFYSKHRMQEEYVDFVQEVISERITPFPAEQINAEDASAKNLLAQLSDKSKRSPSITTGRSILKQKSKSFKKARLLNSIADNLFSFFSDETNLREALVYAEMATEYLDIPEVRLTRGKILNKLGKKEAAITQIDLGLQSPLLDWRIKSDLLGLRKKIIK